MAFTNRHFSRIWLLMAALLACHACAALEYDYKLVVSDKDIKINCQTRRSLVIDGGVGQTIRMKEGEVTRVLVENNSEKSDIAMHWHGLTMRTAPFSDGVPMVSQWPIKPGRSYMYQIRPEKGDAGTYFYHSHVGFQAHTAYGLLIVDDKHGALGRKHRYDGEIPLVFTDYYPQSDRSVEQGLMADPFVWPGETHAISLNGQSGRVAAGQGRDRTCEPHVIEVEPGKTYRLRLVGGTVISYVFVGIEGHEDLGVVEADGSWAKDEVRTGRIQLSSGQRYSALLRTKTEAQLGGKCSYWVRYENRYRPEEMEGYALLRYKSERCTDSAAPAALPRTPPVALPRDRAEINRWMEDELEPASGGEDFPSGDEVTRTLVVQTTQHLNKGALSWQMSGLSWNEETEQHRGITPYLIDAYRNGRVPDYDRAMGNRGWDPEANAFPFKVGEVVDIVWQNTCGPGGSFEFHPMHAHGEHYWDLGAGPGRYDRRENERKFRRRPPMKRDTTNLYRYSDKARPGTLNGWRAWRIRFTEKNVGAWMMHCHLVPHMIMGMQIVAVVGTAKQIKASIDRIPSPWKEGYMEQGGIAYGKRDVDPDFYPFFETIGSGA